LDEGPTEFDHRNVISLSYVWAFPKLKDAPTAVRYIVNDWQTQGIYSYRSGDPLTVLSSSSNNSGSEQNRDRAVYLGSGAYGGNACGATLHCKSYLYQAAFTVNPAGTFGNTQKGEFVGPDYYDWDVSLIRTIPLYERLNMQFRAEYFNVLNHTNLGDPNTSAGSSSFGQITGTASVTGTAGDPRIAQLSLKLQF